MSFSAPNLQLPVKEGDIVDGKYRVESVLGVGGMGAVLAAAHLQLGHRVAIKVLLSGPDSGPVARERFLREAKAAAILRSEHVARVSDVGTFSDGTPFMVLEYLDGQDLGDLVERTGALRVALAVDYVLQACDAVIEAHAHGIVHRDLKPQNLFLTRRPNGSALVKVLDFGISKQTTPALDRGALTRTSDVVGSPLFMSPEQIRNAKDVDERTDIWALGIILYELISGRVPFEATTLPQLCSMVLEQAAPPLRAIRPDVPEELDSVVLRCLNKAPEDRYPDVQSLMVALMPFANAEDDANGGSPFASTLTPDALVGMNTSRKSGARRVLSQPPVSAPKTLSSSSRDAATPAVSDMPPGRRTEDATSSAVHTDATQPLWRTRSLMFGLAAAAAAVAVGAVMMRAEGQGAAPAAPDGATPTATAATSPAISSSVAPEVQASAAPSASASAARATAPPATTAEINPTRKATGTTATGAAKAAATTAAAAPTQPPLAVTTAASGADILPDRRK
jgi:serine/threonine-protein kinase